MEIQQLHDQIHSYVEAKDLRRVRDVLVELPVADVAELIKGFSGDEKAIIFRILPRDLATNTFQYLDVEDQKMLLTTLGDKRFAIILNDMAPDDRTALLEEFPAEASKQLLTLLSKEERAVALTLLGYPEHSVGRLMNPDYIEVKEDWSVEEVLHYIRENGRDKDMLHVIYVVDDRGKLIDDIRIRDILLSPPNRLMMELMNLRFVSLNATDDQEKAVEMFKKYDRTALPVIDSQGHMIGIVTVDDVLDVAEEEATEDIQMLGAVEALDDPYLQTPFAELFRKRARWLIVLFVGELLTATAMGFFEKEIQRAVILALFIPLIISSGGNSGSQAATLIIRALAIGEIALKDWWRVMKREICSGVCLGLLLGALGFLRIVVWSQFGNMYGPHWVLVGITVSCSLTAVVIWGVLSGAMLPFLLKKLGADPATSSAPFVATLVDVTGLIFYFTIASAVLGGVLL